MSSEVAPVSVAQEYPPRMPFAVAAITSFVLLVAAALLLRIPLESEMTVIAVEGDRVRVAGLGVPSTGDGDGAVLITGHGDFPGTLGERAVVPDSEAVALVIRLDAPVDPVPSDYSTVRINFGERSLLTIIGGVG